MNRKEFLRRVFNYGTALVAGSLMKFGKPSDAIASEQKKDDTSDSAVNNSETPCEKRVDFAKSWVKRFMNVMDKNLDETKKKQIMESCGKECFCAFHSVKASQDQGIETVDRYLQEVEARYGKENAYREENKIYYSFVQNPKESKTNSNHCLCPLTEDGPEGLSPTYCICSTGYVKEMFERMMGQPVRVELIESLHRGGKKCSFLVNIS